MHQACRICRSDPEIRNQIEEALILDGKKFREVAKDCENFFGIDPHLLEQSIGTHFKNHIDPRMTSEDLELLRRAKQGEVSFEEITRYLQAKAFEKMLRDPDSVKISDWLKSENLKMKKAKQGQQSDFAGRFLASLFGGFTPPENCPRCGLSILKGLQSPNN